MIKGETKTGFAFELEEAVLDNMELVDALAEMQERTEDGRVPVSAISQEIMDIFEALGKPGKN